MRFENLSAQEDRDVVISSSAEPLEPAPSSRRWRAQGFGQPVLSTTFVYKMYITLHYDKDDKTREEKYAACIHKYVWFAKASLYKTFQI